MQRPIYRYGTFRYADGRPMSSDDLAKLYREYVAQDEYNLFDYFKKVFTPISNEEAA